MACIHLYRNFDPNADAQALHKAMKGMGCDGNAIVEILAHRTVNQRKEIEVTFKAQFGKDLQEQLKEELRGNFQQICRWSFLNPAQLNAAALRKATKGAGTDEDMLIDVICTANNVDIRDMKEAFKEMTGKKLEDVIESETSGDFRRVLISILQGARPLDFDEVQANADAQELYKAGEEKRGTDESTFIRLICASSFNQIRLLNKSYQKLTSHSIMTAIEKETSGNFRKALIRVVQVAINKAGTIADIIYNSMKGIGTRELSLSRAMLAYAETDLGKIKAWFDENYEKPLAEMISGDTSGDYKRFLLSIIE